jgi:type I restriction enzyme R subunit
MPGTNEAFSRVKIDAQLKDQGWDVLNPNAVRFEYVLPDRTKADYVLCDRHGRALAVIEAKKAAINPAEAEAQAKAYAAQLEVPCIFLANGEEIRFWEWQREAFPRAIKTFYSQGDLERRAATGKVRRDPLTVAIDKRIVERDYQTECIETLCREMNAGRRKMLVEMATGTGKTRTAAALIKRLFEANAITRVLFLVDRIPLAKQTEDAFAEHLPDFPAYVLRAGRRFQDEKRITITTLQSMVNIYHEYSSGYFDLVISDECHRSIYGKWSGVLKHFDGVQVGLTATPCIADPAEFGDEEDKLTIRDTLRFFEVDRPTFSFKLKDAIREGYLVPYQIYKAKTVKTAAEGGFPVRRDELDWSAMDQATRPELEALFGAEQSILIDPAALERKFTIPERNRAIVREFRDVMEKGYQDAKGAQRKPLFGKTIVFAVTRRHAETLAQMLDSAYAGAKPSPEIRYADYVVSGMGAEDTVDGMTKIKRFKKEKFPQILVSVNMLDTGFDCPEVMNLVFARFTKSAILYRQMRGRGTRKFKGKPLFTMFDFVGVTDFHGDQDEEGGGGVVVTRERKKTYEPRKLLSLDISDHIDPTTREWITVDENGNMVFPEASEAKKAILGARFEAWFLAQDGRYTPDQERWLRLVGSQLRANADTAEEFTAGHFAFHPFTLMGGLPEAIRVFGGEESLDTMLESLNADVFRRPDPGAAAAPAAGARPS